MKIIAAILLLLVAANLTKSQTKARGEANGLASEVLKTAVRKLTSGLAKDIVRTFDTAKCAECISTSGEFYHKTCVDPCKNVITRMKNEYLSSKNKLYDNYRTKDCLNCAVRNNKELREPVPEDVTPNDLDLHCSDSCCYYNCSRKCRIKDLDRILAKIVTKANDEYLKTEFDFTTGTTIKPKKYSIFTHPERIFRSTKRPRYFKKV